VKRGGLKCPFCDAEFPSEMAPRPGPAPDRALTRAALIFAGASTVAACSSSSPVVFYGPVVMEDDAGTSDAKSGLDAGDASESGERDADASPVVFYGPVVIDSSVAVDATSGTDAGDGSTK
jgi:hypothetical protein